MGETFLEELQRNEYIIQEINKKISQLENNGLKNFFNKVIMPFLSEGDVYDNLLKLKNIIVKNKENCPFSNRIKKMEKSKFLIFLQVLYGDEASDIIMKKERREINIQIIKNTNFFPN